MSGFFGGMDLGSTCTKTVVLDADGAVVFRSAVPTGWDCVGTARAQRAAAAAHGCAEGETRWVATGYGRVSVPFADRTVTEITCHGRGAARLFGPGRYTVVDIGGQDTKVIAVEDGAVKNFVMNDKCSAGTGRFLEVMSAALGLELGALCELARASRERVAISSMCTVFAESEVVSLIGRGAAKADIARGIVDSIADKVRAQAAGLLPPGGRVCLTGGLCGVSFILEALSERLGASVESVPDARYAGALGAAMLAAGGEKRA